MSATATADLLMYSVRQAGPRGLTVSQAWCVTDDTLRCIAALDALRAWGAVVVEGGIVTERAT